MASSWDDVENVEVACRCKIAQIAPEKSEPYAALAPK